MKAVDKDRLRRMLEAAVSEKLQTDPDAITLYAPVLPVTPRPYQAKLTAQQMAYQEELERIQTQASDAPVDSGDGDSDFAEYPGLVQAAQGVRQKRRPN